MENNNQYDLSLGKFINMGNSASMSLDKMNKLTNIPLPLIEIKHRNNANFAKKEYCTYLNNDIDILSTYKITINIILKKVLNEYEFNIDSFIDNTLLYLTIFYNNGIIM
jgi:hypothetical protein